MKRTINRRMRKNRTTYYLARHYEEENMKKDFLEELRELNKERQKEWDPENKVTISFRGLEFAGEAGELASKVKKLARKVEFDLVGSNFDMKDIEEEVGDVLITLDLLCEKIGVDIAKVTKEKFNATSDKVGMKTKFQEHCDYVQSLVPYTCIDGDFNEFIRFIPSNFTHEQAVDKFIQFTNNNILDVYRTPTDEITVPLEFRTCKPNKKIEPFNSGDKFDLKLYVVSVDNKTNLVYSDNGFNAILYLNRLGLISDHTNVSDVVYYVTKEHLWDIK